jgi:hypothetical protein
MHEVSGLACGGSVALLAGWVYLQAYRRPSRNALTAFLSNWYAKHSFSFLGGPMMVRILGIMFTVCGALMWCLALWKATVTPG